MAQRNEIADRIPTSLTTSVALGELVDMTTAAEVELELNGLSRFRFAKIGLAQMGKKTDSQIDCQIDWQRRWLAFESKLPRSTRLVAVAYADAETSHAPAIDAVLELAAGSAARILLLDTFEKSRGSSLSLLGLKRIRSLIATAHRCGVRVVLAGSVSIAELPQLMTTAPDWIGVRGAVCENGRERLDETKLRQFVAAMKDPKKTSDSWKFC